MILIAQSTCILQCQPDLLNVRKQTMIPTLSDTGIDYSQVQSPLCLNFIWLYFINKLPYIWQICVVAKEQNARVLRCKRIFFEPVSRPHGRHLAAIPFASLVKSLNNVFAIQDIQLWKINYFFNIIWTFKSIKEHLNLNFSFKIHKRCFKHPKMVFRNSQNTSHVIISFQWI